MLITQSTSVKHIPFMMVDSGDHLTPKDGLNPTVQISKNCGSWGTPAGAVSGIGLGWYFIAANNTDSNTLGPLLIHASGSGADLYDGLHEIVAFNPNDSVSLGLTGMKSNVVAWSGASLPFQTTAGVPDINIKNVLGSAAGGSAGYLGLDWNAITNKTSTVNLTNTAISGIEVYTGNTKQTGDNYSITSNGTYGNSALKTLVDTTNSYIDTEIGAIKAKTDNLPSDPADASDIASSFSTVNSTLSTIASYIDTEIGSIKTQTDKFRFDSNNLVLSNVSGIYPVTASGLANTILSQSAKCTENTAPSGSLTEIILQSTNSVITDSTLNVRRSDGTFFSTKSLGLVPDSPSIRSIQ